MLRGLSLVLGDAAPALCSAALCSKFPLTRAFVMLVALAMLLALWLMLTRTRIGLVIQAALTHPSNLREPEMTLTDDDDWSVGQSVMVNRSR